MLEPSSESDAPEQLPSHDEDETPTMPPPPLPEGPVVELVVADLLKDPRAE